MELPTTTTSPTTIGAERVGASSWIYPSYEILLDTPVVFGSFDLLRREVDGADFFFAPQDEGGGESWVRGGTLLRRLAIHRITHLRQ